MPEVQWYYARNDQQFGPVSAAELKQLADSGKLPPDDLLWHEGSHELSRRRPPMELDLHVPLAQRKLREVVRDHHVDQLTNLFGVEQRYCSDLWTASIPPRLNHDTG